MDRETQNHYIKNVGLSGKVVSAIIMDQLDSSCIVSQQQFGIQDIVVGQIEALRLCKLRASSNHHSQMFLARVNDC